MEPDYESDVYVRLEGEVVEHYALITQEELASLRAALAAREAAFPPCVCGKPSVFGSRKITGDQPSEAVWLCSEHMDVALAVADLADHT